MVRLSECSEQVESLTAKIPVVDRLPSAGMAIADVLRRHAADIVVMGAYGHSRMREEIFGGVTRAMTEKITLPLFVAL